MEVLTGEQMRRADAHAIETLGIPGLLLMEAAGQGIAERILATRSVAAGRPVWVLCGKGNNGGDGLVIARHLVRAGISPHVVLFARCEDLTGDPRVNLRAAQGTGLAVTEAPDETAWRTLEPKPGRGALIVDALLGTGVRGGARGVLRAVIDDINRLDCEVVAVDLPSGLDADNPATDGIVMRATATYTLCRPKLPLAAGRSDAVVGRWEVVPIGIPDAAVAASEPDLSWFDDDEAAALVGVREAVSHKGTYGHVLVIAGSRGKAGAAVLAATSALRSGAGLVTVATPHSVRAEVAGGCSAVMTESLAETADGTLGPAAVATAGALLRDRDALAIGPGLGMHPDTARATLDILADADRPAVIDADGINALATASGGSESTRWGSGERRVLTPHPGEAARLLGVTPGEVQSDRLGSARRLACDLGAVTVLKGHRTVVASPDGRASFNASGNPALATAGSGDVLTGMIVAWLGRGLRSWDAARLAVWIHGAAGDLCAEERGQDGTIATDLLDAIPRVREARLP